LPITPEKILRGLAKRGLAKPGPAKRAMVNGVPA
jgi:hypothetical protein